MKTIKKLPDNELIFFQSQDGKIHMEVMYAEENIWLNQKAMAKLFDCSVDNISLHFNNLYEEGELDEKATSEESSIVQKEGNREEYKKYKPIQSKQYISDFDREMKKLLKSKTNR